MVYQKHVIRIVYTVFVGLIILPVASCNKFQKATQEDVLHELGIDGQVDFSHLSTCAQIEIYTTAGSQFLDRDHFVAILPIWIDEEISKRPAQEVIECISNEGEQLLDSLPDSDQNKAISLQIHALVYLAYNDRLLEYKPVNDFVLTAACHPELWYEYNVALIYYAQNGYDLNNIPETKEMIDLICNQ